MQILAQEFLPIVEQAGKLAFVDIEASNLKADFGTVVVVSIKPYGKKPITFTAPPGRDKTLLKDVSEELHKYALWATFYGKLFDVPYINSRLLVHGLPPLEKRHHLDMYFAIKARTCLSRRNQAHLLSWLGTPESKMSVSPSVWAEMAADPKKALKILAKRCESDVTGLEAMYERAKPFIVELTR
jgi:hypothetical protein